MLKLYVKAKTAEENEFDVLNLPNLNCGLNKAITFISFCSENKSTHLLSINIVFHLFLLFIYLFFKYIDERICSPPFMVLNTECSPDVLEQIKRQGLSFPFSE